MTIEFVEATLSWVRAIADHRSSREKDTEPTFDALVGRTSCLALLNEVVTSIEQLFTAQAPAEETNTCAVRRAVEGIGQPGKCRGHTNAYRQPEHRVQQFIETGQLGTSTRQHDPRWDHARVATPLELLIDQLC